MKYYYLDSEKAIHGPYSIDELRVFCQSGVISDDTLSAAAGDNNWKPLSVIFAELHNIEKCSTWNNTLGSCPHCTIELDGDEVPEFCPSCKRNIHGAKKGILRCFVYALKNSFNYKGRSTRLEFWGFYVVYYLLGILIAQIGNFFISHQMTLFEKQVTACDKITEINQAFIWYMQDSAVAVVNTISAVYTTLMIFPFLAVSVRRLHDTGRSAFSVILVCFFHLSLIFSFIYFVYQIFILPESILNNPEAVGSALAIPVMLMMISGALAISLSIYLLVMMLLPSSKGSNKYGPSALYPKG